MRLDYDSLSTPTDPVHKPAPTTEAKLQVAEYWTQLTEGEMTNVAVEAAQSRNEPLLWSLSLAHLVIYSSRGNVISDNTCRCYRAGLRALLTSWDEVDLLAPKRDAGPLYLRHLETAGLRPSSIGIRLTAARHLYRALRWSRATTADPFDAVRTPKDQTAPWDRRQPYTDQELGRLLSFADHVDAAVLLLGAHTGLRASEMVALQWSDLDINLRSLRVHCGKGLKARSVSLSGSLIRALAQLERTSDYVLPFRSYSRLSKRIYGLCDRAAVPRRGLHALRHYSGTRVMRRLNDLEAVARHLGHSNLETARIYAKWCDSRLHEELGRW